MHTLSGKSLPFPPLQPMFNAVSVHVSTRLAFNVRVSPECVGLHLQLALLAPWRRALEKQTSRSRIERAVKPGLSGLAKRTLELFKSRCRIEGFCSCKYLRASPKSSERPRPHAAGDVQQDLHARPTFAFCQSDNSWEPRRANLA